MKSALPDNAKIAKEAKECMQECVSEFISFITSEGVFSSFTWSAKACKQANLGHHLIRYSIREMSTGETQDGQRRGHLVCHDITRLRKLFGSVEDLSRSLSRGKNPSPKIFTTLARKHLEGIVENATTTGLSSTVWPKVFCGHILQVTFTRHLTGVLPMLDDTPANSIASCLDWDP
jgi:hypothetical protein